MVGAWERERTMTGDEFGKAGWTRPSPQAIPQDFVCHGEAIKRGRKVAVQVGEDEATQRL